MSLLSNNKIILHLDTYSFVPGDTIRGKIELSFPEGVKANSISIGLYGVNKQINYGLSQTSGATYQSSTHYFYSQKITLMGAGEYASQHIPFAYTIPVTILPKRAGSFEKLGNLPSWAIMILNIILSLLRLQQPQYLPEFSLEARVDIPWGIDITEKIPVSIEQKVDENINIPNILPSVSPPNVVNTTNIISPQ